MITTRRFASIRRSCRGRPGAGRVLEALVACAACVAPLGCKANAAANHDWLVPPPVPPPVLTDGSPPDVLSSHASFAERRRGKPDVLVILALSGGGSRAAYFSAEVMLSLEDVCGGRNLLHEVDFISSVSGGSLPAAYYCVSRDATALPDPADELDASRRSWDHDTVLELMGRDYRLRWLGNSFWPWNFLRSWTTAFDRSDVMAKTFADNLFDVGATGRDLTLGELAPGRPHLLLNATDATRSRSTDVADGAESDSGEAQYGQVFTFTAENFGHRLNSDVNHYPVANAVMASAAFPAVFPYVTLNDFRTDKGEHFVHVFDGGNSDNLGLLSVQSLICKAEAWNDPPSAYVVICVDAHTRPRGVGRRHADPRSLIDYAVDTNFFDAFDSLLTRNRASVLLRFIPPSDERGRQRTLIQEQESNPSQLAEAAVDSEAEGTKAAYAAQSLPIDQVETPPPSAGAPASGPAVGESLVPNKLGDSRYFFWHIQFSNLIDGLPEDDPRLGERLKLYDRLNEIATGFKLGEDDDKTITTAVRLIMEDSGQQLERVCRMLDDARHPREAVGRAP